MLFTRVSRAANVLKQPMPLILAHNMLLNALVLCLQSFVCNCRYPLIFCVFYSLKCIVEFYISKVYVHSNMVKKVKVYFCQACPSKASISNCVHRNFPWFISDISLISSGSVVVSSPRKRWLVIMSSTNYTVSFTTNFSMMILRT